MIGQLSFAQSVSSTNLGANQVTLEISGMASGTAYLTLLDGGAKCGAAAQIQAGEDSKGNAAYRIGSLTLVSGETGNYTVRNLMENTIYSACVADASGTIESVSFTTSTETSSYNSWAAVGAAGFSAGVAAYENLAFGPDGTPYVAYRDGNNSNKATVMMYTAANGWTAVGAAGFSAGEANYVSLAFAPDGTPYVAYQDWANSGKATVMKYTTANGWTAVGAAGFSAGAATCESVAVGPDGTPYVAFEDESVGNGAATVMKYTAANGWTSLSSSGVSIDSFFNASLAIGFDGTPYLAGTGYSGGAVLGGNAATVVKYEATVDRWTPEGPDNFSAGQVFSQSLAVGPDGTLYLAYQDVVNNMQATVMKYSASSNSWTPVNTPGFSANGATAESLAFAPDGAPYLAYLDWDYSGKVTVMKYNAAANSWTPVGRAGFTGSEPLYFSLAIGMDGTPYLAYRDSSNSGKATVMSLSATAPAPVLTVANPMIGYGVTPTTLTAQLAYSGSATPTGAVTFQVNGGVIVKAACTDSSSPLTCTASYATGSLTQGGYTIASVFAGDANYAATYSTGTLTVSKETPTVTVSDVTTVDGSSSTLTAAIAYAGASAPTGTVSFQVGSGAVVTASCTGSSSLFTCTASYDTSGLAIGTYVITAAIAGDTYYTPASSTGALTVIAIPAPASVTVTPATGMATLHITSGMPGVAHLTILDPARNAGATCGTSAQIKASLDSKGNAAYRIGSLTLVSGVTADYTVRNLMQTTTYTACVADAYTSTASASFTTNAEPTGFNEWVDVGGVVATGADNFMSMVFGPDGTPYVAYMNGNYGEQVTVRKYDAVKGWTTLGGVSFSTPCNPINDILGCDNSINLAVAPDGTLYAAYADGAYSFAATVQKYNAAKNTWSTVGPAGFTTIGAFDESLAFGPDGAPYLAYDDANYSGSATVVKYDALSDSWTTVGQAGFTEKRPNHDSLAIAPDGTPYFAYQEINEDYAKAMKYDAASNTWKVLGASGASTCQVMGVSLAFSPDGVPYIGFAGGSCANGINVVKYDSTTDAWIFVGANEANEPEFTRSDVWTINLAFAPDGLPYVAYDGVDCGNTCTPVMGVLKYNGAGWVAVGRTNFASAVFGGTMNVAFAPNGTPYLAFEGNNNVTVISLTATMAAPTITVKDVTVAYGDASATLTAQIAYAGSIAPTGIVTFQVSGGPLIKATCTGSASPLVCTASYLTNSYPLGSNTIVASYVGDANFAAANGEGTLTVTQATPVVTVSNVAAAVGRTQPTTLTAVIAYAGALAPTGAVTFQVANGAKLTPSCAASGVTAILCTYSYDTSSLSPKTYAITASIAGDANYLATTGSGTLTVLTPTTPVTVATTPAVNQVTLQISSSMPGLAHLTVLDPTQNAGATCGSAAQIEAGEDSKGNAAYRIGSLTLASGVAASYAVRNLIENTSYIACVADAYDSTNSANFTTNTASLSDAWALVGDADFSSEPYAFFERMVIAPDGTPYVAYSKSVMKYDAANGWTLVGPVSFVSGCATGSGSKCPSSNVPKLSIGPDGALYLAYVFTNYQGNYAPMVVKYDAASDSWKELGDDIDVTTSNSYVGDYLIDLAVGPDGAPYLVYTDYTKGTRLTVTKYNAVSNTWTTVGASGFFSNSCNNPGFALLCVAYDLNLAIGPDGAPYVVFQDLKNSYAATVMKYDATNGWTTLGNADFSAAVAGDPSLAFAPDGTPHVAFTDDGGAATVMKYASATNKWTTVGLAKFTPGEADYVSLAFAADGEPYVAYEDGAHNNAATVMKYDFTLGRWTTVSTPGFSGTKAEYTSLAFAPNGMPYVAYADYGAATVMSLSSTMQTASITVNPVTMPYNVKATLTASLNYPGSSVPTGAVTFQVGSGAVVTASCTGSSTPLVCTASYDTSSFTLGSYTITASFAGDAAYSPSSGSATLTIIQNAPTVTVFNASTVAGWSQATALTATIAYAGGSAPTGAVTFQVGSLAAVTASCTGSSSPLVCTANYVTSSFTAGVYTITAAISSDANYSAAQGTAKLTVNSTPPQASIAVTLTAANLATLQISSSLTGPAHLTVLDPTQNAGATCGSAAQTGAGEDSKGNPAFRIGSLTLASGVSANYTTSNLAQTTAYTACVADAYGSTASASFTTTAEKSLDSGKWVTVGAAGLSSCPSSTDATFPEGMAFAPDGTPYVAFDDFCYNAALTVKKYDAANGWTVVGNGGFTASTAYGGNMAIAPDGTLYVVFGDGNYPAGAGFGNDYATVMKYDAANGWTVVGNAGFTKQTLGTITGFAIAPDGTPYMAYTTTTSNVSSTTQNTATVMKYDATTNLWITVGADSAPTGYIASAKSLVIGPDGAPYIVINSENGPSVMKYDATNGWTLVGAFDFATDGCLTPNLAFAPDGTLYVACSAYAANEDSTLSMWKYDAVKGWTRVGAKGFVIGDRESLTIAPDGSPIVEYVDNIYDDAATAMRYDAKKGWTQLGNADFSAGTALYAFTAIAPDGSPYVVYTDFANSYNATVMKFQSMQTPTVTAWPTASSIAYGQTLASSILTGGAASVPGTFAWTLPTRAPDTGTSLQSVTFTPTDTADYWTVTGTVSVTVNPAAKPVTAWPTASSITYGQTLASSILSGGAASVPGVFAWTTPTTVPGAGTAQQSVTFTPKDATDYASATGTVSVTVNRAKPTVTTWPTASNIAYGQTLASSILSGGAASVPGVFAWTNPTLVPNMGIIEQSVVFTPTDSTDYTTVEGTATLTVGPTSTISLTVDNSVATLTTPVYFMATVKSTIGAALTGSVTFSDASTSPATVLGTVALSNGAATLTASFSTAGAHNITAVYSGSTNYPSVTGTLTETAVDFAIASIGSSKQKLPSGGTATYTLGITYTPASTAALPSATYISITGLPSGITVTQSNTGWQTLTSTSWRVPAGTALGSFSFTVKKSSPTSSNAIRNTGERLSPLALALLLLPFAGRWRRAGKRLSKLWCVVLLMAAGAAATAGLSGCSASFLQASGPSITVTAASGSLSRSANLTLIVK